MFLVSQVDIYVCDFGTLNLPWACPKVQNMSLLSRLQFLITSDSSRAIL